MLAMFHLVSDHDCQGEEDCLGIVPGPWRAQPAASPYVTLSPPTQGAPASFTPYLEPLVAEVQKLWDQALIREGERVLLWEGE